jgi:hypothetical protein
VHFTIERKQMSDSAQKETDRYKALLALAEYMYINKSDIPYEQGRFEYYAEQAFIAIQDGKIPGVRFVEKRKNDENNRLNLFHTLNDMDAIGDLTPKKVADAIIGGYLPKVDYNG